MFIFSHTVYCIDLAERDSTVRVCLFMSAPPKPFFFFFKFSLLRGGKKSLLTQQLDCGALPSMHHFRPVYIT